MEAHLKKQEPKKKTAFYESKIENFHLKGSICERCSSNSFCMAYQIQKRAEGEYCGNFKKGV